MSSSFFGLKFTVLCPLIAIATVLGAMSSVSAQLIIESSGEVLLKRGSSEYRQTGVGERLQPGDSLMPTAGATVEVLCKNSDIWTVPAGIASELSAGCPEDTTLLVRGETKNRPGGNNPNIPFIIYPRMMYVSQAKPTFRWNGVEGASVYTVRLIGPAGKAEWETEVQSTALEYPDDAPPLEWGVKYLVTVEADNGASSVDDEGGILGFEVLDEFTFDEVQNEAKEILVKNLTDRQKAIALAELYRKEGLIAEAISTLESIEDGDGQTALVYRLLGDLYSQVGLNLFAGARYENATEFFQQSLDRFAIASARAAMAGIELMLGNSQEADRLANQTEADYLALGHLDGVTELKAQLDNASRTRSRLARWASEADASSVSHIVTPRD